MEGAQFECRGDVLAWKAPGEEGEQIALLAERAFERRQQKLRLSERGLLQDHVRKCDLPGFVLPAQDSKEPHLQIDEPPDRRALPAQRSLLDGRERDVGGEREINAFALKHLDIDELVLRLDL